MCFRLRASTDSCSAFFLALRTRLCCERWRSHKQVAGGHHLLHERPERGLACPARVTKGESPRTHTQRFFSHKTGILVYQSCNQVSFWTHRSADCFGGQGTPTGPAAQSRSGWRLPTHFGHKTISGRLVYQVEQDEHKVDVPLSLLPERSTSYIALQSPSSVGIGPVIF